MRIADINNMLGARGELTIEGESPLLLLDDNAAGKSSVLDALRACAARDDDPRGLGAAGKAAYRTEGAETAHAELHGVAKWVPGHGIEEARGALPRLSPLEAGLASLIGAKTKAERITMLEATFVPEVDEALVREAVGDLFGDAPEEIRQRHIGSIVKIVKESGWKAAEDNWGDRVRAHKREWENAAGHGERYGITKAGNFHPAGWHADLDVVSVEEAEKRAAALRQEYGVLERADAVSEEAAERGKQAAAALQDKRRELEKAQQATKAIEAKQLAGMDASNEAQGLLESTRQAECEARGALKGWRNLEKDTPECPGCATALYLDAGEIKAVPSPTELAALIAKAEKAALRAEAAHDKAKADWEPIRKEGGELKQQWMDNNALKHGIEAAINVLEDAVSAGAGAVLTAADRARITELQDEIRKADGDVRLIKANLAAREAHGEIVIAEAVKARLGPKGVRGRRVADGLANINHMMKGISKRAAWPDMSVDADGIVKVAGRAAVLCSSSEKWRARLALQIGALYGTGKLSHAHIFCDDADVLDPVQWKGLCALMASLKGKYPDMVAVIAAATGFDRTGWPGSVIHVGGDAA